VANLKKRIDFLDSEEGKSIKRSLLDMIADKKYNTPSSYSTNINDYPDNLIPFLDKHINCLNTHPQLDANKYIANLKLMTRLR
jgi:hypothetical protein